VITSEYCSTLADYNHWMNTRLFETCGALSDRQRKEDRSAFFGSIHSTLNHILFGDLAFMSRFTGDPATIPELGKDLHEDFEELRNVRLALDDRIVEWAAFLSEDWLVQALTYESKVDGVTRTVPRWVLVTHMFNHATHHRPCPSALSMRHTFRFVKYFSFHSRPRRSNSTVTSSPSA